MKGWRTLLWNAANAVVYSLDLVMAGYSIPEEWKPVWLGAYFAGNVVLRFMTTSGVFKSD
jgi:hypothetical protein